MHTQFYIGRFAPSPSGPLHFGSLVAALGSYLQAKSQGGRWLVRIEDIDPPREVAGAAEEILATLQAHQLNWDSEVQWQSQYSARYEAVLKQLIEAQRVYACQCTRAQIKQRGGIYNGHCRQRQLAPANNALRFKQTDPVEHFSDQLQGKVVNPYPAEDFIIKRKDGLFAYHLAMVADDIAQGITQVVRGADLLMPTFNQIALYQALGHAPPGYLHLPVAVTEPGKKLSKQNHAPAINAKKSSDNLFRALVFLGQNPPANLQTTNNQQIIEWGVANWQQQSIPKRMEIPVFL